MINSTIPTPQHPADGLLSEQAAHFYGAVWLPRLLARERRREPHSPPAAYLTITLTHLLHEELLSGRLLLEMNVPVPDPRGGLYEVDLLIRQPSTGAALAVEVDGWSCRREMDAERHRYTLQRGRALDVLGLRVVRIAGSEARWRPWQAALIVVGALNAPSSSFHPVTLPQRALRLATHLAHEQLPQDPSAQHSNGAESSPATPPAATRASTLEEIRARVDALPRTEPEPRTRFQRALPRVREPWTPEEERLLLDAVATGAPVDQVAGVFGRHPDAVRLRLRYLDQCVYRQTSLALPTAPDAAA